MQLDKIFDSFRHISKEIRLTPFGGTSSGKSALGNSLLSLIGEEDRFYFKEVPRVKNVKTLLPKEESVTYRGVTVKFYDSPGYFDVTSKDVEQLKKVDPNQDDTHGFHCLLLTQPINRRFNDMDRAVLSVVSKLYENDTRYVILVLTHGDTMDTVYDMEHLKFEFAKDLNNLLGIEVYAPHAVKAMVVTNKRTGTLPDGRGRLTCMINLYQEILAHVEQTRKPYIPKRFLSIEDLMSAIDKTKKEIEMVEEDWQKVQQALIIALPLMPGCNIV